MSTRSPALAAERRLLLIRHGRSSHEHRDGWVDARGVERWRDLYDAAGIADDDVPPAALRAEIERAGVVVASDLARAVASAKRLVAADREIVVSPLVAEAGLAIPRLSGLRLPMTAWGAVIHLRWLAEIAAGTHPRRSELERATEAARWLETLADEHGTVAVVTHGVFRGLLARRLRASGWRSGPGGRSYRHWSAWAFRS